MIKSLLFFFSGIIFLSGCHAVENQDRSTASGWVLPKVNPDGLSPAPGAPVTQVYDDRMLKDREVTFRDERLLNSNGTKSIYALPAYTDIASWEKRKQYLHDHILICSGLWPMPAANPLNPHYYHKIDHGQYVVETVTIETYPGFFLAGNIYRPSGKGPFPAILAAHGHFPYGRLNNDSINSESARSINFARQGYVVFAYDMTGYNDTRQVTHGFARDSVSLLYGINLLGLQLRNSLRALDFLLSLPDVDSTRVGVTGASGGATQVFMLTAVDNRFQAAAPVNMISDNMQGGDLCENAPGLRINSNNMEIAAMIAPKPLLMVSDTYDWTYDTRNSIFPALRSVYRLYGAENRIKNVHFDFIHNYNRASTEAVQTWFGQWLLGDRDPAHFRESAAVQDSDKNLLAFMNRRDTSISKSFSELPPSAYHDLPNTLDEAGLKKLLQSLSATQLTQYWPKDAESLATFRDLYGKAARHLIGAEMPESTDQQVFRSSRGRDFLCTQLLVSRKDRNEWIPCLLYQPLSGTGSATVILTGDKGKAQWVDDGSGTPGELVRQLLSRQCNVLIPDLFKQGEHRLQDSTKTRRDEKARYFNTFNLTDRQEQVQDLLTLIRSVQTSADLPHNVNLYAQDNSGLTGLLLASATPDLDRIVLDGNHFFPGSDQNMLTLQVPGILRIGGLKTLLALCSDKHLLFFNADESLSGPETRQLARLAGNETNYLVKPGNATGEEILGFLTR